MGVEHFPQGVEIAGGVVVPVVDAVAPGEGNGAKKDGKQAFH